MFRFGYTARCLNQTYSNLAFVIRMFTQQTKYGKVTDTFIESLKGIVGAGNVSTAEAVREQHGHDESHHDVHLPDVVIFAESAEHVSKISKLCNDNKIPIIPFGSGTGLEGGVNAIEGGVCLDLSKMDQVVQVNNQDFDCSVQPGVMRLALNKYLRDTGLFFPVDPGADCSVCGMCATSASGTMAVRYGTMRENVLNLQVVLPDGRIIDTAGKGRRTNVKETKRYFDRACKFGSNAGYNLTNLFIGSEGTLGIITQATVRLYGIPEKTVQDAVTTVVQIMQCGIPMAKLEFLDDSAIDSFNKYSKHNMPVTSSLFLEFHGPAQGLENQFDSVKALIDQNNGFGLEVATDETERTQLWKARHEMLWATLAQVPGSKAYSTDVCVPIAKLPEIIVKTKEMIDKAKVVGTIVGHVGDGNFHVFFPVNHEDKAAFKKVSDIATKMALLGLELNGTCTGEHGIGMGKRDLLQREVGETGLQVMRQVKYAFDPNGIMNPGKIFF